MTEDITERERLANLTDADLLEAIFRLYVLDIKMHD